MFKNKFLVSIILLICSIVLRYFSNFFLNDGSVFYIQIITIALIIFFGIYILRGTAKIIEETTEVLSEQTGIAGGVLQSFGTAFPDMVLGIVAAILSLSLRNTDFLAAINYAIIAAATTFGSNIYNVGFSAWCVYRQNLADTYDKNIPIFPFIKSNSAMPLRKHLKKPSHKEMDISISVLAALSVLTSIVAISMVVFGRVKNSPVGISGDLYQLIQPVGLLVFIIAVMMIFVFRKSEHRSETDVDFKTSEHFFRTHPKMLIWLSLIFAGIAILFSAESMIKAVSLFSILSHIPVVLTGTATGIIGSLGEMFVVYNFTINPRGRIGDAIVGVAMDNIVTIIGASIVAMIGGIFLGGNALILIFVIILCLDTILIWQVSVLKDRVSHV